MQSRMCVYLITNEINGKRYIGQTTNALKYRWYSHKYNSLKKDFPLCRAIRKYGANNFTIKILSKCDSIEELNHREEYYIKIFKTMCPNGYNAQSGGKNCKASEETRKKISMSSAGKNNGRFGKEVSKETRDKISKAKKGRPGRSPSDEGKARISKANSGKRPFLGKSHTEDTRKRMSKARDKIKIRVFCVTNNTYYDSLVAASKELNVERCRIKDVLRGKRNHVKGFVFKEIKD